ncbi:ATP-binding protein [Bifidobacterium tibiigranuli]|jgi:predicted AAA+ superfamily ATPase|uniref:ATP-binding protein n=1 Tax=Bifidobacterium tibiigranuli TaxID=2172043 RepID=UPI0023561BED|nr:ATP-binding protein [Bifidobacterium tibiigranuli]MCI1211099.1 ATP-binding protein [Bifidobacterium tibiigranuli]MCI1220391.1 ATP-binding protein [Bifidobacterium tibiigranuli]
MLSRKALHVLKSWKKSRSRHRALMLTGARQIGKTTLVREFARNEYAQFAELNFLTDDNAASIFAGPLDAQTIITNLTAYLRTPLEPGNTLVLLDEIQECPRARTAIKFLVEDGRFDYIETGSLLGVRTGEVTSYPVGFEEQHRMFPMDFEEFCLADGVQSETITMLREHFANRQPVSEAVHETMSRLFLAYIVVGGMPEIVQRYVDTHDIAQIVTLQHDILDLYRLDIAKYAETSDRTKIRSIFDAVPSQLDDRNRRFVLANLNKNARQNRYASSFLWLADAGVALPCYNVTAPVAPLQANAKHSLFKLFMNDTGLLCASSLDNVQFPILQGDLSINMGAITENVVAQELLAHGFTLFYFDTKRYGEVDFVIQSGAHVLPIEVKSGNDWTIHKALGNTMAVREWHLGQAYVLCKGNLRHDAGRGITYLPLYMTMFLAPERLPDSMPFNVDLSALNS